MEKENYLYLMCNPDKWFGEKHLDNYKTNDILYNLSSHAWSVSHLKNIHIGMLGILKVSRDDRAIDLLKKHNVAKLESGIYATFEVIDFIPDRIDGKVTIKIVDNFFHQNRILNKEKTKEILGDKYNAQSQGYIHKSIYDLVYENVQAITYIDLPKLRKNLIVQEAVEVYPRDEEEKREALILAKYKCELEENHMTFTSNATSENYVEGHHLIPISQYVHFDNDVDVRANIVSLCPTCHRMLHYGEKEEVHNALSALYSKRINRLKKVNLDISLEKLHTYYKSNEVCKN
ncbi:MAG: HNH endonuclease [Campylobacterales bacterium]|nr:HNH endonuclease [Campylobacterales bacterium]